MRVVWKGRLADDELEDVQVWKRKAAGNKIEGGILVTVGTTIYLVLRSFPFFFLTYLFS
jgi:hypothetical protein